MIAHTHGAEAVEFANELEKVRGDHARPGAKAAPRSAPVRPGRSGRHVTRGMHGSCTAWAPGPGWGIPFPDRAPVLRVNTPRNGSCARHARCPRTSACT